MNTKGEREKEEKDLQSVAKKCYKSVCVVLSEVKVFVSKRKV